MIAAADSPARRRADRRPTRGGCTAAAADRTGRNADHRAGGFNMTEPVTQVRVGQPVPDFELTVYDPEKHDFGKVRLEELKAKKRWTILFFYPADFTFV
jgi:hypothetical protein